MADLPIWLLGFVFIGVAGWLLIRKLSTDAADKAVSELRAAIDKKRAESIQAKKEKGDEVDNLAPASVDQRYERWLRDKDS